MRLFVCSAVVMPAGHPSHQMASVVVHYFRLLLRGFVVGVVKPTTIHAGQAPSFCCMNVEQIHTVTGLARWQWSLAY